MLLRETLEQYPPDCEQEARDRALMLAALTEPGVMTRENPVEHFTASAWVINGDGTRVLMLWHNIYQAWSWAGGHTDGEEDLLAVALREVEEETGLKAVPLRREAYSLEILTVDGHRKNGVYVAPHLHLNVTYLLRADDAAPLREKPDENSGVRWLDRGAAVDASTEPYMRLIYAKLNDKLVKSL